MRYKLLGKSGLRVSEMSLGTMTFGTKWGWGADKETSKQILEKYTDVGGNFIDTSCNYTDGESESFIGEFVKGYDLGRALSDPSGLSRPVRPGKDLFPARVQRNA